MGRRDAPLVDPEDFPAALGLLTRLPSEGDWRQGRSAWAWPLAGLVVAVLAGLGGWLLLKLGFGAGVVAAAVLAIQAILTGAMHEDGLADTADGLAGRDPAERMEIMKDSRIGTYGVLALLLVTLVRWQALTLLLAAGHWLGPVIAAAALSRAALPVVMVALPPVRGSGLSSAFGVPPGETALLGVGVGLALALLGAGLDAIPALVAGALAVTILAATARARLGGQTGDVLGASQQVGEATVLAVLAAAL